MKLLMFPGQGSQKVGMGFDIFSNFNCARDVFLTVDDALGFKLSDLIFNGPDEALMSTENTQVALMTTSIAYLRVLEEKGFSIKNDVTFFAGHSLGEYTALCAAGVLSLEATAKLLRTRGIAMKECSPTGTGMAALLGLSLDKVESIASKFTGVEIANDNCDGQVVVSGLLDDLTVLAEEAKDCGAKRAVILNVSGPFHSSMMEKAVDRLAESIEGVVFNSPIHPVISNVTASPEIEGFSDLLLKQIVSRVRWRESIISAHKLGVTEAIEVGPSKVLTGLVKRIAPDVHLRNIGCIEDL